MVGEACLPSNAYYPRTPDYTLCSGIHVCWSEHSDSSFVYGFMSLDHGFGNMTTTTSNRPVTKARKPIRELFAVQDQGLHLNVEGTRRLRQFFFYQLHGTFVESRILFQQ